MGPNAFGSPLQNLAFAVLKKGPGSIVEDFLPVTFEDIKKSAEALFYLFQNLIS